MTTSLTSLLEIKEQWDNIESSSKEDYSVFVLQREDNESDLVRLVKNKEIVRYLEETKYQLETKLTYKNLLRFIAHRRYLEGKIDLPTLVKSLI